MGVTTRYKDRSAFVGDTGQARRRKDNLRRHVWRAAEVVPNTRSLWKPKIIVIISEECQYGNELVFIHAQEVTLAMVSG